MTMGNHQPLSAAEKKGVAQHIDTIYTETGFTASKTLSTGPRYRLVLGTWQQKKAIFKISLRPATENRMTNEKLSRETMFLQYVAEHAPQLAAAVPRVYAGDFKPRAWYIREYISGTPLHPPKNEALFKQSFFTTRLRGWLVKNLKHLHGITARDLPQQFNELLYHPELPSRLWNYVQPYTQEIDTFLDEPGVSARLKPHFTRANPLFRNAPIVLAHQELYPSHILKSSSGHHIIDWENIGWALPTYDYVVLWLRAFDHPQWQAALYESYQKRYDEYRDAQRLWQSTVFIQSVFNVVGYHFYPGKKKFKPLADYCANYLYEHAS